MDISIIFLIAMGGFILLFISLLKPRMMTFLLIFVCVIDLGYFSRWFGAPRILARTPYFLSILLFAKLCLDYFSFKIVAPHNTKPLKALLRFIVILIFISVISFFYNNNSITIAIFELRYYLLLLVLYLSIFYYLPLPMEEELFIKTLAIIGLIQIPFTVIQYSAVSFYHVSLNTSSITALDISSGTFISYPVLVFIQCVSIGFVLTYQFKKNLPILIINNYLLMLFLMIPLLLSNSRSAVGIVLILVALVTLRQIFIKKNINYFLKNFTIMITLLMVMSLLFYFFFFKKHDIVDHLNIDYIIDYFFHHEGTKGYHYTMARGTSIIEAIKLISKSFATMIFGVGAGSFSESDLLGVRGQALQVLGPLAGLERIQLSKTLVEYGLMGVINFYIFFLCIFKYTRTASKYYNGSLLLDIYYVLLISMLMSFCYSTIFHTNGFILVIAYYIAFSHYNLNRMEDMGEDKFGKRSKQ